MITISGDTPRPPGGAAGIAPMGGLAAAPGDISIPLPFMLVGLCGAALFGVLLPLVGPLALLVPDFPHVLALVHVATLGWLTMIMLGASLQLVPVMLVAPLRATKFLRLHFPAYLTGVVLLISGFWWWRLPLLIIGGSLVVASVIHHVAILGATIAQAKTRPLSIRFMAAALGYLLLVVSLGLTAALNLQFDFLDGGWSNLLLTHLTLGIVGWLTCTLMGVSYTLVRMFALVHGHDDALGTRVFWCLQAGIVGLALGFALGWEPLIALGGLALTGAVWLFTWDVARMVRLRRRKPVEVAQRHAFVAVGYLALVMPLAVVAALRGNVYSTPGVFIALALAAFVGWLGQSTVGYTYKIVPFLIWNARYAPLLGKQRVPLLRDLLNAPLQRASFWLINLGLPVAICGALLAQALILRTGGSMIGAGLLVAAANVWHAVLPKGKRHAPLGSQGERNEGPVVIR